MAKDVKKSPAKISKKVREDACPPEGTPVGSAHFIVYSGSSVPVEHWWTGAGWKSSPQSHFYRKPKDMLLMGGRYSHAGAPERSEQAFEEAAREAKDRADYERTKLKYEGVVVVWP